MIKDWGSRHFVLNYIKFFLELLEKKINSLCVLSYSLHKLVVLGKQNYLLVNHKLFSEKLALAGKYTEYFHGENTLFIACITCSICKHQF